MLILKHVEHKIESRSELEGLLNHLEETTSEMPGVPLQGICFPRGKEEFVLVLGCTSEDRYWACRGICPPPLYTGGFLLFTGIDAVPQSIIGSALTGLLVLPLLVYSAVEEERRMLDKFGEEYADYRKHTAFCAQAEVIWPFPLARGQFPWSAALLAARTI